MTIPPPPPTPPAAVSQPARRPDVAAPPTAADAVARLAVAIARRELIDCAVVRLQSAGLSPTTPPAAGCEPNCRAAVWNLLAQLRSAQAEAAPLPAHMAEVERRLTDGDAKGAVFPAADSAHAARP